jgi:hypothetical protein
VGQRGSSLRRAPPPRRRCGGLSAYERYIELVRDAAAKARVVPQAGRRRVSGAGRGAANGPPALSRHDQLRAVRHNRRNNIFHEVKSRPKTLNSRPKP